MSDPARTHSDGSLPFGTQDVTIYPEGATTGGTVFIAEGTSPERDSDVIMSKSGYSIPYRKTLVEKEITISLTLQFPTKDTPPPLIGQHFAIIPRGGDSDDAIMFDIKKVGTPTEQSGEAKVTIDAIERFNPVA